MKRLVVRSQHVELPTETAACDIVIEDGRFSAIDSYGSHRADVHDVGNLAVLPGLVDTHVHINAPGRTDWEGFATGTRAAQAGGITTLVDMPLNSSPVTSTPRAVEAKRREAEGKLHVDVAFHAGLIPSSASSIGSVIQAGCVAAKAFLCHSGIDEFPNASTDDLLTAMPTLKELGVPLLVHAEVIHPVSALKDPRSYSDYLSSRPRTFERTAIELLITLASQTGCHVHIVHLADGQSVSLIAAAQQRGVPITVETCPHYLSIESETIRDGQTEFKCAPPIRGSADREALWNGLRDGVIEMIVSDHSPCPPEMKRADTGRFDQAWGGISSLQLGLPLIWTEASTRGFSLRDVVRWMSAGPADLVGLPHGIEVGNPAHLVVFDSSENWTIDQNRLFHRHPITPYHGRSVKGLVRETFVHGQVGDTANGKIL